MSDQMEHSPVERIQDMDAGLSVYDEGELKDWVDLLLHSGRSFAVIRQEDGAMLRFSKDTAHLVEQVTMRLQSHAFSGEGPHCGLCGEHRRAEVHLA